MIVLKFRRIFLTFLFILGAGTLLLGYGGIAEILRKDYTGAAKYHDAQGQAPVEENSAGKPTATGQGIIPASGSEKNLSFFVDYRLQRERSRGRQLEILREILNSPSSAGDARQLAQEQLLFISKSVAREARLENMIRAKGYNDAVVCMDQNAVTVVLDSPGISASDQAGIIEIVSRETGMGEQSITVIAKK